MADTHVDSISLKALVDKETNRVIFAESDGDFVDVLFSFLTMPMGTIIRLTRNQPPAVEIGCMNNLYKSVENLDALKYLQTEACKTMLLCPQNGAETHCKSLKVKIDDTKPMNFLLCFSSDCTSSKYILSSPDQVDALSDCGGTMSREKKSISTLRDQGVFVRGITRLLITDDFQVMPPFTEACISLLSNLGVMDGSTVEERTFDVGAREVLNLLKHSLVSKTPLTETLLKHKPVRPPLSKQNFGQEIPIQSQTKRPEASNGDGKISVKIMVNKSRNTVSFAEAKEDFVDLLFSFLTVPLGSIVKEMQGWLSKGCVDHLHRSVQDLDAELYMKSEEHKAMLVSPKVAPGFRYENQPLSIEEASHPQYRLTTDEMLVSSENPTVVPKSQYKEATNGKGFTKGQTMFKISDDLVVSPIPRVSGRSFFNKLKASSSDIEERVVHVGNEEASRLLMASFVSKSALTNAFIRRETEQE